MGVRSDLFEFLVHLPATDSPDERKAMVIATGYPNLGIYLDWQGANVEFFGRLLDVFGRREHSALEKFLRGMNNAPQVSDEGKAVLAELRSRVAALDSAGWQQEFATAAAPAVAAPAADPAMLATTVVTQVLTPYYKVGPAEMRATKGNQAAKIAEQVAQVLESACADSPDASDTFAAFKDVPEEQTSLIRILKRKLGQDPVLAKQLADIATSTAKESQAGLEVLSDVSQTIGTVRGTVIGAALGNDVMGKINVKVVQKIKTVEKDGTVTGLIIGSL